jgi:mono/diheme cytochrome c family protein
MQGLPPTGRVDPGESAMKSSLIVLLFLVVTLFAPNPAQADSLYTPRAQLIADGSGIFDGNCSGCHGVEGRGNAGSTPPLANSDFFMAVRLRPAHILLNGLEDPITVNGLDYAGTMPNFSHLSDYEIASVLTYLRAVRNDSTVVSCNATTLDEDGFAACVKTPRDPSAIATDSIAVWEVALVRNPPPAPVNLAYADQTAVYVKGVAITPNSPTVTGTYLNYSVAPSLPAGLSLNAGTGVLSGTPTTIYAAWHFIVQAQNVSGSAFDTLGITVIAPPARPTNVTGALGDGLVTVSWTAPTNDSGGAITSYTATATPGGATCTTPNGATTQCTVTGLTNGTNYRFSVRATNLAGAGTASALSAVVVPNAPPVIGYAVDTLSGKVDIALSLNKTNTGGPVASWTCTPAPPTGIAISSSTGNFSGTPTGLSPVSMHTIIASGPGGADTTVLYIVVGPGNSPTVTYAVDSVAFTVGTAVTPFQATITGVGVSLTISPALPANLAFNPTTSGRISGTPTVSSPPTLYRVIASNQNGADTALLVLRVYAILPSAPLYPGATPANQQATVTWTEPTNTGGEPITGYLVRAVEDSTKTCTWTKGPLSCVVTNLINGQAYSFVVAAINSAGQGPVSASTGPKTPGAFPAAPTGVTGVRGNEQVIVSWLAPGDNGGFAISSYTVTAVENAAQTCTWTTGPLSCTVTGLTNGIPRTFIVRATNAQGTGVASAASVAVTPATVPGAPTGVAGFAAAGQVALSWTAPTSNGGSPLLGYTATASPGGAQCAAVVPNTTCTVSGLTNGTTYTFTVRATNDVGSSLGSTGVSATPVGLLGDSRVFRFNGEERPYTFTIPAGAGDQVTMRITDLYGRTVWHATVGSDATATASSDRSAAREITWNGRASNGMRVSAGLYIVHIILTENGARTTHIRKTVKRTHAP